MINKRLLLVVAVLLSIASIIGAGWAFYPWPDRAYQVQRNNGSCETVKLERRYRWLPSGERELSSSVRVSCGGADGGVEEIHRIGFFEMIDAKWTTTEK